MTVQPKTLNQLVSAEKQIKSRIYSEITQIDRQMQKPELLNGFSRKYKAKDDQGERFPDENKHVQVNAGQQLNLARKLMTEMFDLEATKDNSNGKARADIKVGDKVIVTGVPATTLLFLEKQLNDLHTLISRTPSLDPAERWSFDQPSQIYKSEMVSTHRTKKNQRPIVLYEATKEHPAQTQLITEDEVVGFWDSEKHSGALPVDDKHSFLEKINQMTVAVKHARETANNAPVEELKVGDSVLGFIFS